MAESTPDNTSPSDRTHRVPDYKRPEGGPFGPGKKKKKPFDRTSSTGYSKPFSKFPPKRPASSSRDPFAPVGTAHANSTVSSARRPSTPTQEKKSTPTHWSDVGDWYDSLVGDDGSEFHQKVIIPQSLRLLEAVAGGRGGQTLADKDILDIACGQGVFARALFSKGAKVTGIDAAETLIAAANTRNESLTVTPGLTLPTFILGDAKELPNLPDNHFDLAACILAIQNIHPLNPFFASAARVLKPGGSLLIVMMHPAFRTPKESHWGWDAEGDSGKGVQYRRVDKYLSHRKEPIITHPGQKTGEYTWSFHRPISEYITAAAKHGLLTSAMEEWPSHKVSDSGPRAPAENTARKEIPMFLALRVQRVVGARDGD